MSIADKIFKDMCCDILENGTTTEGQEVRPVWPDTKEKAYTIKKFGVCNRYDLREEFPAITFRPTALKSALDEIFWIYQKKSNNVRDLNSHIWDQWADDAGSIGTAYGWVVKQPYVHHFEKHGTVKVPVMFNQIDAVLYDLKHNLYSRRIMTNLYDFQHLSTMHLHPCAYSCTFNVTDEGYDKPVLNLLLNQRSQDVLVANNWNVAQYAMLLMMIAQVSNMIPGELVHMIADAHIYDRHVDIVKELINRPAYDAPIVKFDPDVKDFYKFTLDSLTVENYKAGPQIKNIPVAV